MGAERNKRPLPTKKMPPPPKLPQQTLSLSMSTQMSHVQGVLSSTTTAQPMVSSQQSGTNSYLGAAISHPTFAHNEQIVFWPASLPLTGNSPYDADFTQSRTPYAMAAAAATMTHIANASYYSQHHPSGPQHAERDSGSGGGGGSSSSSVIRGLEGRNGRIVPAEMPSPLSTECCDNIPAEDNYAGGSGSGSVVGNTDIGKLSPISLSHCGQYPLSSQAQSISRTPADSQSRSPRSPRSPLALQRNIAASNAGFVTATSTVDASTAAMTATATAATTTIATTDRSGIPGVCGVFVKNRTLSAGSSGSMSPPMSPRSRRLSTLATALPSSNIGASGLLTVGTFTAAQTSPMGSPRQTTSSKTSASVVVAPVIEKYHIVPVMTLTKANSIRTTKGNHSAITPTADTAAVTLVPQFVTSTVAHKATTTAEKEKEEKEKSFVGNASTIIPVSNFQKCQNMFVYGVIHSLPSVYNTQGSVWHSVMNCLLPRECKLSVSNSVPNQAHNALIHAW